MYQSVIEQASEKMEKTKDVYRRELVSLRAGRANPKLLDRIMVDYYGTQTPLNQMANIMSPEPRMLTISLWDPKAIPLVEKAIQKSDLGLNPANDGKLIRLVIPELNEERRKELTKLVWRSAEESKVAIRSIRRDAMEHFKKMNNGIFRFLGFFVDHPSRNPACPFGIIRKTIILLTYFFPCKSSPTMRHHY